MIPPCSAREVWKVFRRDGYDIEVLKGVSLSSGKGRRPGWSAFRAQGRPRSSRSRDPRPPDLREGPVPGERRHGSARGPVGPLPNRRSGSSSSSITFFRSSASSQPPCPWGAGSLAAQDEARRRAEALRPRGRPSRIVLTDGSGDISAGEQQRVGDPQGPPRWSCPSPRPTSRHRNRDWRMVSEMVDRLFSLNRTAPGYGLCSDGDRQRPGGLPPAPGSIRIDDGRIAS